MPVCIRCGNPAPNAEVLFCNRCGAAYPPVEPEPVSRSCPRCGNSIPDELSEYCNRCGAPVHEVPEPDVLVCSRCGNPAPDAEALFCNKCGTGYKKEPESVSAVCPRCGFTLPDDQSQFCNRCGAPVSTQPVNKKPVCKKCGAAAPDEETLFCNRCGTPFNAPASPLKTVNAPEKYAAHPVSVKISKKKPAPVAVTPEDLWDTVPAEQYSEPYYPPPVTLPASSTRKKYAHLPLVADEFAGGKIRDEIIDIPQTSKKYGHLPLIADELKEKQSPHLEIETPYFPGPPKEMKAGKQKKGFLNLLKK